MFAHTVRPRLIQRLQSPYAARIHTDPPVRPNRFSAYTARLTALASRTGVSLPSLALSFGILHELTALVPLVGLFFAFQAADVGTGLVRWAGEVCADDEGTRWRSTVKDWLGEGERRVDRVARRYGLFGYDAGTKREMSAIDEGEITEEARQLVGLAERGSKAAADVTNAIAAYVLVKVCPLLFESKLMAHTLHQALLPARIGVSLAFAPAFSRRIVDPTRRFVWHRVLRRPNNV